MSSFVCVCYTSSLFTIPSLFSLRTRRSFPKERGGNETASEYENHHENKRSKGRGWGNSLLPPPSPSFFFAHSLLHPLPTNPIFFLLTPGALVCSLACSICPPGKWKGNVSYAGSISFAAMLRIMTQWFSPQASRSVARRLEYLKILASCLQEAFLQCSYVLVFKKC